MYHVWKPSITSTMCQQPETHEKISVIFTIWNIIVHTYSWLSKEIMEIQGKNDKELLYYFFFSVWKFGIVSALVKSSVNKVKWNSSTSVDFLSKNPKSSSSSILVAIPKPRIYFGNSTLEKLLRLMSFRVFQSLKMYYGTVTVKWILVGNNEEWVTAENVVV